MTIFRVYLLHEHQRASYKYLESYQVEAPVGGSVKLLKETALEHAKSHWGLNLLLMKSLDMAKFEIYQCLEPLQGKSEEEKEIQAIDTANRGNLDSCVGLCLLTESLGQGLSSDLIIVYRNLRFDFVIFEKRFGSYDNSGSRHVTVFPSDLARKIHDAARSNILELLCGEDPDATYTITNLSVHEVKVQYETDYQRALKGELDSRLLKREFSALFHAEDNVRDLTTSNIIVLFTATREPRKRLLRIPYVLFNHESGSYRFSYLGQVDASSEDTVVAIHDAVRQRIDIMPIYEGRISYFVKVFEPREAFQSTYNKQPSEMTSLELEDENFIGNNCSVFHPRDKLSDLREGQTLIIVFGIPAQPEPTTIPTSIVDKLLNLDIGAEPSSTFAKLENYQKFQTKSEKRILDDRPNRDKLVAPTPLLFQPFGYFHDIRCGLDVPRQREIHDGKLRRKVDQLADEMILFHGSEEDRRSKFLVGLEVIFDVTPGTINASKILGTEYFSDGHLNGNHGIMVFCLECKNEISTASCEPVTQLVAYVAASLRSRAKLHIELFNRWRVPILGVVHVGPNVQFFGIVWVGKMRITPLTPLLPMVDPVGDGFRWDLFLAFKAARIVFANIRTHIQHILGVLDDPDADRPPLLTNKTIRFPSITEIKTYPPTDTDTQPKTIKFILESRHDNIEHRELYQARLISPASDKAIYVKFSQRYSVELHRFCAEQKLAPRILGFQELHGGWCVVAMEKIDTVDYRNITSFPEAGEWKSKIEDLVREFHQKGLVHGDLRLANFVFTSDEPRRMILVDFDWGGKDGEVEFPHEELIEDLGVSNSELYGRKITKEHDLKCLEKVTGWLGTRIFM